jgi:hypothetical protein
VRAALFEFQRYLSDQTPPLLFAESMSVLLRYRPESLVPEIHSWISAQFRGEGTDIPVSDYIFHAVKKIHFLGEFNLLPADKLKMHLDELKELVLDLSPIEDREFLRKNLEMISSSAQTSLSSAVEVVHRQAGSESRIAAASRGGIIPASASPITERRMLTLINRMQHSSAQGPSAMLSPERQQILSQALTTMMSHVRSSEEMQESLASAQETFGIDSDPAKAFRLLSESLPTWAVPVSTLPPSEEWPDTAPDPLMAMSRIIGIADDPAEGARRFRHLVDAAVERFNEGSLGRAVTMIELAERLAGEKKISEESVKSVRRSAHEQVDQTKLRAYSETKDAYYLLRKFLNFFTAFTPDGLLDDLAEEQRREKRRAILAVLEVHGAEAWRKALERLRGVGSGKLETEQTFFVRNLLYVLNRIAPPPELNVEEEIDLIAGFTATKYPPVVLKESIGALAQTRNERAEKILIRRISDLEAMASKPAAGAYSPNEVRQLLDRVALALGRFNTPAAIQALLDHAMKTDPALGDTAARLGALASQDLSANPEVQQRIIGAVRAELPKRVLGFVSQKNNPRAAKLIEALAGTPSPEVYELLQEVTSRYPETDFGRSAAAVLAAFGIPKAAESKEVAPSLTGDMEVLGLPALLQTLSSWRSTGILTIYGADGKTAATLSLEEGKVVRAHAGLLRGKDAIFQLFEEAAPGTFAFVARRDIPREAGTALEIEPVILEAVRRFDELREARLLVPESAELLPTGAKPAPFAAESDAQLVREVWLKAVSGQKPSEWKSTLPADSYRIWRLLAHWTDTGALQSKEREAAPADRSAEPADGAA